MNKATADVTKERNRQITEEGFDAKRDDIYQKEELVAAASSYLQSGFSDVTVMPNHWPFDNSWWKPKDRRSSLVKAAALICAEIDRMDRVNDYKKAEAAQYMLDNFENFSDSINQAGWMFNEEYLNQTGKPLDVIAFNNLKAMLNSTIREYLKAEAKLCS